MNLPHEKKEIREKRFTTFTNDPIGFIHRILISSTGLKLNYVWNLIADYYVFSCRKEKGGQENIVSTFCCKNYLFVG